MKDQEKKPLMKMTLSSFSPLFTSVTVIEARYKVSIGCASIQVITPASAFTRKGSETTFETSKIIRTASAVQDSYRV